MQKNKQRNKKAEKNEVNYSNILIKSIYHFI